MKFSVKLFQRRINYKVIVEVIPLTDQCPRSELVSIRSGNENGLVVDKISVDPSGDNGVAEAEADAGN